MASGKFGSANPVANVWSQIGPVQAGKVWTLNICAVNMGTAGANVRVAISSEASTPLADQYIEYDTLLIGKGSVMERYGLVAGPGEKVFVSADTANVSFRVHGFEGIA